MSNLISGGKWDSEGQTAAACMKAAAPKPAGRSASLGGCPSILDSIKGFLRRWVFPTAGRTPTLSAIVGLCCGAISTRIAFENRHLWANGIRDRALHTRTPRRQE